MTSGSRLAPDLSLSPRKSRSPRSQEERSAETRARLLDATIDCLVDVGYARTTTTMVAERAGLSRGAQVHHFPTKAELVVKAIARLGARRAEHLRAQARRLGGLRGSGDRLSRFVELLWEDFSGPLFYALLELWVAARTEPDLLEPLREFERAAGRAILEMWRELAGDVELPQAESRGVVESTLFLMQGMALQEILRNDGAQRRRVFDFWKRSVVQALARPTAEVA